MYHNWLDRWDERRAQRGDEGKKVTEFALDAELADQPTIGAVDAQRYLHAHVAQRFDGGQARAEIEEGAAEAEQQCAEQGDTGPRQKLQQTHWESGLSGGKGGDWAAGKRQKLFTL